MDETAEENKKMKYLRIISMFSIVRVLQVIPLQYRTVKGNKGPN